MHSKFVGHFTEIIQQSKVKEPLKTRFQKHLYSIETKIFKLGLLLPLVLALQSGRGLFSMSYS